MLSRFSSAASSGTRTDRKTRVSSRKADQVDPGVPGDVRDPSPPERARRGAVPGGGQPPDAEAVDPVPGDTEERGQQRDRRGHHDQHDDRDGDTAGGHERYAATARPRIAMTTVPPAKTT